MTSTLNCYFDLSSLYSYLALYYLIQNRPLLESHGVEVNINPVYNAELLRCAGNRPPWVVLKKQQWLEQWETVRAKHAFGKPNVEMPGGNLQNLRQVGLTEVPMRALLYIKRTYSRDTFETTFHYLFAAFWEPPQRVVNDPEVLQTLLAEIPLEFMGKKSDHTDVKRLFSNDDVQAIMEGSSQDRWGADLTGDTHAIADKGAFGVPWFIGRNSEGKEEPFFGSDRFNHIYAFLGVPFQDVTILPKA